MFVCLNKQEWGKSTVGRDLQLQKQMLGVQGEECSSLSLEFAVAVSRPNIAHQEL